MTMAQHRLPSIEWRRERRIAPDQRGAAEGMPGAGQGYLRPM
jgi:hypothetical protein